MRILAFDTSGTTFSAALVVDNIVVADEISTTGETHARHVMPALERITAGVNLADVDIVAVSRGPGSFTGLRIGLGIAKGLSYALSVPVIGISTLDALVWPLRNSVGRVFALVDARRGEVYASSYLFRNGRISEKAEEAVCSPEQAVNGAATGDIFCGSGAFVYSGRISTELKRKIIPINPESLIKASDIAMIAEEFADLRHCADPSGLMPVYLRRSEAEINYEIRNPSV